MKNILITSDKYSFCIEGFQTLCARHWKDPSLEFTVLGFAEPRCRLRPNFHFRSLGTHYNDATPWAQALLPYFEELDDECFFLCFEDHFLVGDVNLDLVVKAHNIMRKDKRVGKVRLLPHYNAHNVFGGVYDNDFNYYSARTNIISTTSLRPSIWRRDVFIKLLYNPLGVGNPHEFEGHNNTHFELDTVLLMPNGNHPVYPDFDAFRSGAINPLVLGDVTSVSPFGGCVLPLSSADQEVYKETARQWEARKK